jgi:polysaccharide biosynthesis transport protein
MKAKINRQKPYYAYITINRHWKKIIIAGIITFAILFPIIKIKTKVYYEASGRIKIDPTNASILKNSENSITGYYDKYVKTQAEKIKSTQVIKSAVEKIDGKVIKNVFHTDKKGMEGIMYGILEAEQETGTHLMIVTAKGKSAEGIADVVNAVMEAYIEKDMDEERKKDRVRIDYLQKQKENLENEITKKNVMIDLVVKKTGIGDFEASDTPYKAQTGNLESAYTTAYTDRVEKEKKYNEIKEKIKKIEKLSLEGAVEENLKGDTYVSQRKIWILTQIENMSSQVDGMAQSNPQKKVLEDKINGLFTEMKALEKTARAKAEKMVKNDMDYKNEVEVADAYKDFQVAKSKEEELKASLEAARKKYSEISQEMLKGIQIKSELSGLKDSLKIINERIAYLIAETQGPGRAAIYVYASQPIMPSTSNQSKMTLVAFLFSFGWITLVVFAYDIRDKRIKRVGDISFALGTEPNWPISNYQGEFLNLAEEAPNNSVYKAVKSFTNKLNKDRELYGTKVAMFTGVDSNSGVTELIINSAQMMSENCSKVLIIEMNHENPSFVEKFNIEKDKYGVCSETIDKKISELVYKNRGIDILPINSKLKSKNMTIAIIIEKAREEYDYIYIDTAPIMVSDTTEYIVMKSDVGVLVVHGNKTTYPDMVRAVDILGKLELKVFSMILNWWKPEKKKKDK